MEGTFHLLHKASHLPKSRLCAMTGRSDVSKSSIFLLGPFLRLAPTCCWMGRAGLRCTLSLVLFSQPPLAARSADDEKKVTRVREFVAAVNRQ
jgi:hypothetical protein